MKRIIIQALSVVIVLLLAACGGASISSSPPTVRGADVASGETTNPASTTLEFYTVAGSAYMDLAISQFEKSHPKINVDYNNFTYLSGIDKRIELMQTQLMAGTAPDIIRNVPGMFGQQTLNGLLTDFNTLMGNDPSFNASDYYPSVLQAFEVNGVLNYFPVNFTYAAVTINKSAPQSVIDEFNKLDSVTFLDVLRLYQEMGGTSSGMSMANSQWGINYYALIPDMVAREAERFIDYGKKQCTLNSSDFVNLLTQYKNLLLSPNMIDGVPLSTMLTGSVMSVYWQKYFFANLAFMVLPNVYEIPQFSWHLDGDLFESPKPLVDGDGRLLLNPFANDTDDSFDGDVYVIPAASKNKEAAWELIKFLAGDGWEQGSDFSNAYVRYENRVPTSMILSQYMVDSKLADFFQTVTEPNGSGPNAAIVAEQNDWLDWENLNDILAEQDKYVQLGKDAIVNLNSMPMAPLTYQNDASTLIPVITSCLKGEITPQEAADQLQSKMQIKLNE